MAGTSKYPIQESIPVIGQSNRYLNLPFTNPRSESEHAANNREMQRAFNRIPLPSGNDGVFVIAEGGELDIDPMEPWHGTCVAEFPFPLITQPVYLLVVNGWVSVPASSLSTTVTAQVDALFGPNLMSLTWIGGRPRELPIPNAILLETRVSVPVNVAFPLPAMAFTDPKTIVAMKVRAADQTGAGVDITPPPGQQIHSLTTALIPGASAIVDGIPFP